MGVNVYFIINKQINYTIQFDRWLLLIWIEPFLQLKFENFFHYIRFTSTLSTERLIAPHIGTPLLTETSPRTDSPVICTSIISDLYSHKLNVNCQMKLTGYLKCQSSSTKTSSKTDLKFSSATLHYSHTPNINYQTKFMSNLK